MSAIDDDDLDQLHLIDDRTTVDEFCEWLHEHIATEFDLGWAECELENHTLLVDLPDGLCVEIQVREQPF